MIATGPLLEAKLAIPRRRTALVGRPRLRGRVGRGLEASLTLVSAPAGFGKTTLLTEWASGARDAEHTVGWLSLDARDNDPAVFLAYLIAAAQAASPAVGARAAELLRSGEPVEAILGSLLNDLGRAPVGVVVVLDDYHVVDSREIQDGMAFLLEHLPPRVHLVIATRADPPLPLARLRARGELVEVRAADLRFTREEVTAYLTGTMGLALDAGDVAALEERTEGWIAALQLAALSLQGRADPAAFISDFAGEDRYVVDYLVDEVLSRQPEPVRTFLRRTSVLSTLTGSLCDAVTGQDGGRTRLADLERSNLFLVPLDDRRHRYRYHHLFADVLRARLLDEEPTLVPELHRRASDWYERHGDRAEAFAHALAGGDVERGADLLELAIPALRRDRQDATLRRWLEALPDDVIRSRPVLSIGYAGSLMVRGEVEGVERRLRDAERWLDASGDAGLGADGGPSGMVVVDHEAFAALPSAIAMYRAGLALLAGDVPGTMTHARRALDLAGEDDHVGRGAPAALLALAHWTGGELDDARRWYAEAIASLETAGHGSDALGCALALADVLVAQGRLGEAARLYERGLRRAEQADPVLRGAADMHVGLSEVCWERNDLDAARAHLQAGSDLGEAAGLAQNPYRRRLGLARMRLVDGDPAGAVELIDEAERVYAGDYSPDVRPIPAIRARVRLVQGNLGDALAWVRGRGLTSQDELSYLREFEHVTLARVLLAVHADQGTEASGDASALLARLEHAAADGGRTGSLIEILVLRALAADAAGQSEAALDAVRRAVTLAAPEGYVRVFLDEGPVLASLLRALARQVDAPPYTRDLVAALPRPGAEAVPVGRSRRQGPVEALSSRELDVLRLLATELSGPEIARALYVSLNTVRTHTKNVYAKLGVTSRRAAVRRAEELGLSSRDR